ncbi:hypothetical protein EJ05DRAFT_538708 [Pseudovirgaria hyperparasitica]|uniref:Mediator of RNA polymerase II transcription subunit 12 n=1 Tax=Pseudovirgaria hyperparasitica TaxID=470096 RepID=A0A6A6W4I1_9PEZI|nr:uncharacterized protein EJ05DRAFT_538708 [Pseudovirgaria hyperparasitica]KAF2757523.1 hypothetical protein EJ05DRAFT_538708 [Pseudovirgaria hyperparasitica]
MTSRSVLGRPDPLQRSVTGPPHRLPSRGHPTPQQHHAKPQSRQDQPAFSGALGDGDKRFQENLLQNTRVLKGAPAAGPDHKTSPVDATNTAARLPARIASRGKPQLYFDDGSYTTDVFSSAHSSAGANTKTSQGSSAPLLSPTNVIPFPPRPGNQNIEHKVHHDRDVASSGTKSRKGTFEPPQAALCFPAAKPVDFFPWFGNHQEDVLTENVVKSGFPNKGTMHTESQSANQIMKMNIKNKHATTNLSHLFVKVLEARQAAGRLTAPSTFKPPPRVAFTDSKREAWLKELAGPTSSLRRLSRTIPHGIAGKLLLEQCLSKSIPVPRAVWLTKCVGANEMRAFKRKGATAATGAGSETKWIREWTVFVEQFVEGVVHSCGQQTSWKQRMDYTIRLSTHLYNDRLLDQDHYLDWLLSAIEGSQSDKLPIWLLLVQIHWRDLVASRRRGSRLAESLLQHSQNSTLEVGEYTQNPLSRRLDHLLLTLLIAHRGCLLLPQTWKKFEPSLKSLLNRIPERGRHQVDAVITQLGKRNQRLSSGEPQHSSSTQSPEKVLLRTLDMVGHKVDIGVISAQCMSLVPNRRRLIELVLQWACSTCRTGDHRAYLAMRLLGKWNSLGFETDEVIMQFLRSLNSTSRCSKSAAFRIGAGLVRSKRFNVGKYLQWLIATGSALINLGSTEIPCHVQFILELPTSALSEQAENLRRTLLEGMGYSVEAEDEHIESLQLSLVSWLEYVAAASEPVPINSHPPLACETLTARFAASHNLREVLAERMSAAGSPESQEDGFQTSYNTANISLTEVCAIRQLLEQLEDFPVLADALDLITRSTNYNILSAVADTLNCHSRAFATIGALVPVLSNLTKRYSALRHDRMPDKHFLRAFSDLCVKVHAEPQLVAILKYDLSRTEQQSSIAVCSPASDNMDMLHSTNIDSDEEIERILVSGNSMDEQIMGRVFKRMTTRLADLHKGQALDLFVSWFPRLRAFDEKTFERLAHEWVSNLLVEQQLSVLRVALPILVSTSCISLGDVAKRSSKVLVLLGGHDGASAARMSSEILDLLLPSDKLVTSCRPQDAYRHRIEQRRFCSEFVSLILHLVRQSIDLYTKHLPENDRSGLYRMLEGTTLLSVLRSVGIVNKQILLDAFPYQPEDANTEKLLCVKRIINTLLDPTGSLSLATTPLSDQIAVVIDAIDDLSIPFCQLELHMIFLLDKVLSEEGENGVELALLDAIKAAVDRNSSGVSELVSGLGEDVTRKIREHTEEQILNAVPLTGKKGIQSLQQIEVPLESTLNRYLAVVDSISFAPTSLGNHALLNALIDRLKLLNECLSEDASDFFAIGTATDAEIDASVAKICPWLEALLHLTVAHRPSFQAAKGAHLGALLCILRCLLVNPRLQKNPIITQRIFDIAVIFSDDLTDDMRAHFAKAESSKASPGVHTLFIFGGSPSPDGWLGLVMPGHPATSASAAASDSTSQTAAQPQHPSRISSPAGQSTMLRSSTPQQRLAQQQQQQQHQQQQQQQQQRTQGANAQFAQLQRQNSQSRLPQTQQTSAGMFTPYSTPGWNAAQSMQGFAQTQQFGGGQAGFPGSQPGSNFAFSGPIPGAPPTPATPQMMQNMSTGSAAGSTTTSTAQRLGTDLPSAANNNTNNSNSKPVPFLFRRWELLPDTTGSATGNDTALSLQLFGARRVV